ncbi:MAG TPA: hypothetical protein VIC00_00295 [Candidatus Acidoferrales bacterium]|jgi:hypothetical protein
MTRGFRRFFAVWTVAFFVALAYVGWVFLSRSRENHEIEERAAARSRAQDARTVESLGGNNFDILSFYASPGAIRRGQSTDLCYAVSNAVSVALEPQSNPVWPSYSRCVTVSPRKTTTYTFTAKDSQGNVKTSTLTVEVR